MARVVFSLFPSGGCKLQCNQSLRTFFRMAQQAWCLEFWWGGRSLNWLSFRIKLVFLICAPYAYLRGAVCLESFVLSPWAPPPGPLVPSERHAACHPFSRSCRLKTAEPDSLLRYNQATMHKHFSLYVLRQRTTVWRLKCVCLRKRESVRRQDTCMQSINRSINQSVNQVWRYSEKHKLCHSWSEWVFSLTCCEWITQRRRRMTVLMRAFLAVAVV